MCLCLPSRMLLALQSADGGSGQQHNSSRSLSLTVGVLEVAEHLPFPSAPPNSSATGATTSPSTWVPAEEMARVPAMLPSAQLVQWSLPTFAGVPGSLVYCHQSFCASRCLLAAVGHGRSLHPSACTITSRAAAQPLVLTRAHVPVGDYPLPGEGSASVGIGDTLAQLSDLSQATVYQSAAATITEVRGVLRWLMAVPPSVLE